MSFIMPIKYTIDTLPIPNNKDVKILEVPTHKMAAMGWHGSIPNEK